MRVTKHRVIFVLGILLFISSILLGGCMITEEDYLRGAEKYLKKKYGEEFEGLYGYYDTEYVMFLSPKAKPEWEVAVKYEYKDGKVVFHDNYVAYQLKPEIEKMIRDIAYPIYGECKVYLFPWVLTLNDDWNKEDSLYEYMNLGAYGIKLYTYDNSKQKEEKFRQYLKACISKNIRASGVYITYLTKDEYESMEETKISYIVANELYIVRGHTVFDTDNEQDYVQADWLDGKGKQSE